MSALRCSGSEVGAPPQRRHLLGGVHVLQHVRATRKRPPPGLERLLATANWELMSWGGPPATHTGHCSLCSVLHHSADCLLT